MPVRLHDTLTGTKQAFKPLNGNRVGMYVCGPTVYNYFHIGNARPFVVFDVARRFLRYRGYRVIYVQNFTDIDDKIIARAGEVGVSPRDLAEEYIKAYFEDADALGIERADYHPRATEHLPDIISLIRVLEEKGYAYRVDGDVFFDTSRFPGYGKLSHQRLEELVLGARVEIDDRKRHPTDFALWKGQKPGEPAWDSPWGKGRPGWHVECSAMAMRYLGETLDIHAGGSDLIFPHHENEIAQSEAATGRPFVLYWLHNAYLNLEGEKMSKSAGNILLPRELRSRYHPEAIRLFLLSAHYRSPLNFSPDQLAGAESALQRLYTTVDNLEHLLPALEREAPSAVDDRLAGKMEEARARFVASMEDDLNTADALAALFEFTREVNTGVGPHSSRRLVRSVLELYQELGGVLGILGRGAREEQLAEEVEALIRRREEARRQKNWAEADRIREELARAGIRLEDTPYGVRWKRHQKL